MHKGIRSKHAFGLGMVLAAILAGIAMTADRGGAGDEYALPDLAGIVPVWDDAFRAAPMLGRPADTSITVDIVSRCPCEFYCEYGTVSGRLDRSTEPVEVRPGDTDPPSAEIAIEGLSPDTQYHYRVMAREAPGGDFREAARGTFHTQRRAGSEFVFTVQADSHMNMVLKGKSPERPRLYNLMLENVSRDEPDFHIDMGDFAGIEQYSGKGPRTLEEALVRYLLQRAFLSRISASTPFFLVLGNHEGEQGWRRKRRNDRLEVIGALARKALIPNPRPDGFYTGNGEEMDYCGLLENYYAWEWGDALFVVLDPFWKTMTMPHLKGGPYRPSLDAWDWTLGIDQYNWLYETLHGSSARWKFVFAHHITGGDPYRSGKVNPYGRGGIVFAKYKVAGRPSFEWGGEDSTGAYVFPRKRPGWSHGPVHDLLVDEGVDIFFHGHDHVFVYETLDGIVYQECPQPSNVMYSSGFYTPGRYSGTMRNNSGHLRVTVSADSVTVDYIRAVLPEDEPLMEDGAAVMNGTVSYSYTLRK
jgi:hypothetical protein